MKLDLHVHTRYSVDSISPPRMLAKTIARKGLDGLAVTDHNSIRGWKPMQESCRKHCLHLILGEEIKVTQNGLHSGEILGLFLNEDIRPGDAGDVIDRIRQQDGFVAVSHPFDRIKGFRNLGSFTGKIDAIECFNSRVLSRQTNERAFRFAQEQKLGMIAGSDAHLPLEAGLAWTEVDCSDLEGFRRALKRRETRFSGRMVSPFTHLFGITVLTFKKAGYLL